MPSQSEFTYGSRLRNAQQMLSFIQTYPIYNPPRTEESLSVLNLFLQDIAAANTAETTHRQNYNNATHARHALHRTAPESIQKLLSPIRSYIQALHGKDSLEYKQINTLVLKMREGRLLRTVAADKVTPLKISQSQQSYGSQSKLFADIIALLSNLPQYNPQKTTIQIPQLQNVLNQSISLSDNVTQNYMRFVQTNHSRSQMYAELSQRCQRVKNYIKSEYGIGSLEYIFISNLSI